MSRWCRFALIGQHGQEPLNLGLTHLTGVAQAMKADEPAHPVQVGFLGIQAVVHVAKPLAHLVQKPLGLQRRTISCVACIW